MTHYAISPQSPRSIYDEPRLVAVYVRADEAAQALQDRADAALYRLPPTIPALAERQPEAVEPEEIDE